MTVEQLAQKLLRVPKRDRGKEVFFRLVPSVTANIASVDKLEKSTYGFFGKSVDCYILETGGDE